MRFAAAVLFACVLGSTVIASGCANEDPPPAEAPAESDADDLINGKIAADGDLRPTLLIQNSCTAVKVGPRKILTAAHCLGRPGGGDLAAGQDLMFHTANAVNDKNVTSLAKKAVITSVRAHPNYQGTANLMDGPDVAVITVQPGSPFDDVPFALVDLDPVAVGTSLTLTGYGCAQVMMGGGTGEHTLRFGPAKAVAVGTLGLPYAKDKLTLIEQNFVVTAGPGLDPKATGVCPGDSGGPVYRSGAAKLTVVAINSWTTGTTQAGPKASMLARLHEGSRHSVGEWLSQQGVKLTRPCKNQKRCTGAIPKP